MLSVPRCSLFDGRLFQYGPACAVASNSNRMLVYYPLGSGKTLAAIHGARVFLDAHPEGKLLVMTTLSNVGTTWHSDLKKYRSVTGLDVLNRSMVHNPDWWYSQKNTTHKHYNKIIYHLSEKGYTRQSLQAMSPAELMRICEDSAIRREFRAAIDESAGTNSKKKRLSMLQAAIPSEPYCLIVDECQGYVQPSAQTELVLTLCQAATVVILLSATPLHDSHHYSGLKRLLGNPSSFIGVCLWTSFASDVPVVRDAGPKYVVLESDEWLLHRIADRSRTRAGASENAYLTKSRQACNCVSKWSAMASQIEEDILSADGLVRIVVYSFFLSKGVDGFFDYLRLRWGASVQNKRIKHVLNDKKVRVSMRHEKTLTWFNKEGDEVKILLLTSKDGVGISLKNVRWFHLMESQWSDAEDQQAIGRATRTRSHTAVEPVVRVYRWLSRSPLYTRALSADERVRASMLEKKRRTDRLLSKMALSGQKYLNKLLESVSIE